VLSISGAHARRCLGIKVPYGLRCCLKAQIRKAWIVIQTSKFQPILAGFVESPASARIAQTGTPPPIRIAGTGFRGPGNMRKSQSPAIERKSSARSSLAVFPGSASSRSFALLLRGT